MTDIPAIIKTLSPAMGRVLLERPRLISPNTIYALVKRGLVYLIDDQFLSLTKTGLAVREELEKQDEK